MTGTWNKTAAVPELYSEKYRPQLHYSAPQHWLSDPNGLVWHDGLFHLFFQHNPHGNDWGDMHWGHAVSRDLVYWQHRPVAIPSDPWGVGFAFSGCVVVDHSNTSALAPTGQAPMVALFTGATVEGVQAQCVAFSLDGGDKWTLYAGNPVIANPDIQDFRDPKVFWQAERTQWVMVLAVGSRLDFYVSGNLLEWVWVSSFHCPQDEPGDILECPDLFALRSSNGDARWILTVSMTNDTSRKDRATRYFVGDFNGQQFTAQDDVTRWIDYGPDNYAAITYDNVPATDGRRIAIGWMSNWCYAKEAPTYPWRGHMTLPRECRLVEENGHYELATQPIAELSRLHRVRVNIQRDRVNSQAVQALFSRLPAQLLDLDLEFLWNEKTPRRFGLAFLNPAGEGAYIVADIACGVLLVDRSRVGRARKGIQKIEAPLKHGGTRLGLRIVKDRASVEVFVGDGRTVVSANLFFDQPFESVALIGESDVEIQGKAFILDRIWKTQKRG